MLRGQAATEHTTVAESHTGLQRYSAGRRRTQDRQGARFPGTCPSSEINGGSLGGRAEGMRAAAGRVRGGRSMAPGLPSRTTPRRRPQQPAAAGQHPARTAELAAQGDRRSLARTAHTTSHRSNRSSPSTTSAGRTRTGASRLRRRAGSRNDQPCQHSHRLCPPSPPPIPLHCRSARPPQGHAENKPRYSGTINQKTTAEGPTRVMPGSPPATRRPLPQVTAPSPCRSRRQVHHSLDTLSRDNQWAGTFLDVA
jgi:hypothetical protein